MAAAEPMRTEMEPPGAAPAAPEAGEQAEELIMHLERDQIVAEKRRPLPRAHVGPRAVFALWVLRVFVVLVSAMVIYTFISRLN
jgi:hypothetical protein